MAGCIAGPVSPATTPSNRSADGTPPLEDGNVTRSNKTSQGNDTEERNRQRSDNATENPGQNPSYFDPGWPHLSNARIRPGVRIVGEGCQSSDVCVGGADCTSNFLFRSPNNRSLYLGTAAHCVKAVDLGATVLIGGGMAEGVLAYSSIQTGVQSNASNDFALVRIDNSYRDLIHPAVLHYGGPTGLADSGTVESGDLVLMFGNSSHRPGPEQLDAAEGVVMPEPFGGGEWVIRYWSVPPGISGDSGSPVLDDGGQALGVHRGTRVDWLPTKIAVRLDKALEFANTEGGVNVSLVTWPAFNAELMPGGSAPLNGGGPNRWPGGGPMGAAER